MNDFLVEFYKSYWTLFNETLETTRENTTDTDLYDSYKILVKTYSNELIQNIQSSLMRANGTNLCLLYANISTLLINVDNLLPLNTFAKQFFIYLDANADKAYDLVKSRNATLLSDIFESAAQDSETSKSDRLIKFCCSFKVITAKYLNITSIPDTLCSPTSSSTSSLCDLSKFQ